MRVCGGAPSESGPGRRPAARCRRAWLVRAMADAVGDGKGARAGRHAVTGARGGARASRVGWPLATTSAGGTRPTFWIWTRWAPGLDVLGGRACTAFGGTIWAQPSAGCRPALCEGFALRRRRAAAGLTPLGQSCRRRQGGGLCRRRGEPGRGRRRGGSARAGPCAVRAEQDPAGGIAAEVRRTGSLLVLVCPADVRSAVWGRLMATEALRGYRSAVVVRGPSPADSRPPTSRQHWDATAGSMAAETPRPGVWTMARSRIVGAGRWRAGAAPPRRSRCRTRSAVLRHDGTYARGAATTPLR